MKQLVRETFLLGWRSVWWGSQTPCKDHRPSLCLSKTTHTEWTNWSSRHSYQGGGLCDVHHLSKTKQTEWTSWSGRHSDQGGSLCDIESWTFIGTINISLPFKNNTDRMDPYWGEGQCDRGSHTCVRTTDVSLPVKKNTDRMIQLVRQAVLLRWKCVWHGIPHTCRDHRCVTTCQKQHRQNELAGRVDVATRVEVCVTGDPGHL